jgi:hypothetical protein
VEVDVGLLADRLRDLSRKLQATSTATTILNP